MLSWTVVFAGPGSSSEILPLQPNQIPPRRLSAGRIATSRPPARAPPSGIPTRLDTTTNLGKLPILPQRPPLARRYQTPRAERVRQIDSMEQRAKGVPVQERCADSGMSSPSNGAFIG